MSDKCSNFFVLFWLHLDRQTFNIVWKFYVSTAPMLTNLRIACYLTSGSFLLFINDCC